MKSLRTQSRNERLLRKEAVIPFEYNPPQCGYIVVRGSVGHLKDLAFVVDTGSPYGLILNPEILRRVRARFEDDGMGSRGEVQRARVPEVTLTSTRGPAHIGSFAYRYRDDVLESLWTTFAADGTPFAGILGMETLLRQPVFFSFTEKKMILEPDEPMRNVPGTTRIPLRLSGSSYAKPYVEIDVPGDFGAVSATFLVDTGMFETSFSEDAFDRRPPSSLILTSRPYIVGGIGGTDTGLYHLLEYLGFAGTRIAHIPVGVSGWRPNTLGLNLLSCFDFRFDWYTRPREGTLTVRRRIGGSGDLLRPGVSGIRLDSTQAEFETGWRVLSVYTDQPAYHAGVRPGDRVVAVDGRRLRPDEHVGRVQILLDGYVGAPGSVMLRTQSGGIRIAYFRRASPEVCRLSEVPETGITVRRDMNDEWTVLEVAEESLGARAGLHVGDKVVVVDGLPTRDMSVTFFMRTLAALKKRPLSMMIQTGSRTRSVLLRL